MDPLPEHGIIVLDPRPDDEEISGISVDARNEENEWVLDRLRRNDPTLKELTIVHSALGWPSDCQMILQAFDAIATNSSLKILNIDGEIDVAINFKAEDIELDRMKRALSLNTSLKDISIDVFSWSSSLLDIVMASPNL